MERRRAKVAIRLVVSGGEHTARVGLPDARPVVVSADGYVTMKWLFDLFTRLGRLLVSTADFFCGTDRILCDTCKYDYPSACRNPQRPNARKCKDYARR